MSCQHLSLGSRVGVRRGQMGAWTGRSARGRGRQRIPTLGFSHLQLTLQSSHLQHEIILAELSFSAGHASLIVSVQYSLTLCIHELHLASRGMRLQGSKVSGRSIVRQGPRLSFRMPLLHLQDLNITQAAFQKAECGLTGLKLF